MVDADVKPSNWAMWDHWAQRGAGACVQVVATQGSIPREVGAWMWVWPDAIHQTIGGGNLEWQAMQHARACLVGTATWGEREFALGPSLGQCCGGRVTLRFEPLDRALAARLLQHQETHLWPVQLFGAGHVGVALVRQLALLPTRVHWCDSRDEVFDGVDFNGADSVNDGHPPKPVRFQHPHLVCEVVQPPHEAVKDAAPGSAILVMSHSHAEDFDIIESCLSRQARHHDVRFMGLIGSRTKWASFQGRLRAKGWSEELLHQVQCPVGVPFIQSANSKKPALVALSMAAQLAQVFAG